MFFDKLVCVKVEYVSHHNGFSRFSRAYFIEGLESAHEREFWSQILNAFARNFHIVICFLTANLAFTWKS